MIDFNNIASLKQNGFTGFKTVKELWEDRTDIPREKGVYLILNPAYKNTEFISPGVGGFFKGKNPNVLPEELKRNLVPDSLTVYIGKAGSPTGSATLFSRLGQYLKFGQGKKVGHWGGRYIWQLKNHEDLIFCWKPTPDDDPRAVEIKLIKSYQDSFGMRPFANLVG